MVYSGQLDCYQRSNEVLQKFINIEVSTSQVYLVTDYYGKKIEAQVNSSLSLEPFKKEEVLYVEVDGSMILTREDGWKEVKVGRMFWSDSCIDSNGEASWIKESQYVAHLGGCKDFINQIDGLIESYGNLGANLVFLSDGATWIKNWIEDSYAEATSILDFFHAYEHLYTFAKSVFAQEDELSQWTDRQKELLLASKTKEVIENIKKCESNKKDALINYYESNMDRMDYKKYKNIGAGLIGSGAIESAHRTLVQKRLKQAGQRWTIVGAQNMLNLRVIQMNKQWSKVLAIIKAAA